MDYDNVTTGVAIADVSNGITVYFGCYAGDVQEGGAGVVHLSKDGKSRTIKPLKQKGEKIYAGSMFLACSYVSSAMMLHGVNFLLPVSLFMVMKLL